MNTTETKRPRGRPRDPRADRAILDATIELVAERGIAGASMSAIADRAGCGKPTIYLRHDDRQALVAAALDEVVTGLEEATLAALDQAQIAVSALKLHPHGRFLLEAVVMPRAEAVMGGER